MEKTSPQPTPPTPRRRWWRLPVYLLVAIGLLVGTLYGALQLPTVQTYLAQQATGYLSEKLDHRLHVERVAIRWFDAATLVNLTVADDRDDQMVRVDTLQADFALAELVRKGKVGIDAVTLVRPDVRLAVSAADSTLNINRFIRAIVNLQADTTGRRAGGVFQIDEVRVVDGRFRYADERTPPTGEDFDYLHMDYAGISGQATDLRVAADTFELRVHDLRGMIRGCDLPVHHLSADLRYTKSSLHLDALRAEVGSSTLGDTLHFDFDPATGFGDFLNKVRIQASLRESVIAATDLGCFAPALQPYTDTVRVSGRFRGYISRFNAEELDLRFGQRSYLAGSAMLVGLPDARNTFIELDLKSSRLTSTDLRQYIARDWTKSLVGRVGQAEFSGRFVGFPTDFVANGTFDTPLGRLYSDINLKLGEHPADATYEGNLETYHFHLGRLIDRPQDVQRVTLRGRVAGQGLTLASARADVDLNASRVSLRGYDYRNIRAEGRLGRSQFAGTLAVRDTNLHLTAQGAVDLRRGLEAFDLKASLSRANLRALRLSDDVGLLRADVDLDVQGLNWDDLVGRAQLTDAAIGYRGRTVAVDTLQLTAERAANHRQLTVASDLVSGRVSGAFSYPQAVAGLSQLVREYVLIFENDSLEIERYYGSLPSADPEPYQLDFDLTWHDVNPVVRLFDPNLYVSPEAKLLGSFTNGATSVIVIDADADSLVYQQHRFYGNRIDLTSSKVAHSNDVVAALSVLSREQNLVGMLPTRRLEFDGLWSDRTIDFTGFVEQTNNNNEAEVSGALTFLSDRLELRFEPSRFRMLQNNWRINTRNLISFYAADSILFENLTLRNDSQRVALNGWLTRQVEDSLKLVVSDFDLREISYLLSHQLDGTVNASLSGSRLLDEQRLDGFVTTDGLTLDGFQVGDVSIRADWEQARRRLRLDGSVRRADTRTTLLKGYLSPYDPDDQLNLTVKLNQAELRLAEPFLTGTFSDIEGSVSGQLRLVGSFDEPMLLGELDVTGGALHVDYLNTRYRFADRVYFTDNEIGVRDLRLYDPLGNVAVLTRGGIYHDGFRSPLLSLQGQLDRFQVLNTRATDNDLYYGEAYVTGNVEFFGPFNQLEIKANVRSERGTHLRIPLEEEGVTGARSDYITFVGGPADTLDRAPEEDLSWLRMDLTLDITEAAQCDIIFDAAAGDLIRGNGTGQIQMNIDTRGDFTMFGQYTIREGRYRFTFQNVINKEFIIQPGGTISWNGDPFGGVLNLQAIYEQYASLDPIIDTTGNSGIRDVETFRTYPIEVVMDLQGDLMAPDINLDVDFGEISDFPGALSGELYAFQSLLRRDEQELNRQVFSLLLFRSLSPPGTMAGRGFGQGASGNLTELISNQLSNLVSQIDENFQVNIDLNGVDAEALNALQLRLTYTLFDGRLRVSRGGGFINADNSATVSSIAGDWTIEYALFPGSGVRLKMFSRNNQNRVLDETRNTVADYNGSITTGFSVLHSQSFNKLRELVPFRWFVRKEEAPTPDGTLPDNNPAVRRNE